MQFAQNLESITYDLSPKRSFFEILDKFEGLMGMSEPKNLVVYLEKLIVDDLFINYIKALEESAEKGSIYTQVLLHSLIW